MEAFQQSALPNGRMAVYARRGSLQESRHETRLLAAVHQRVEHRLTVAIEAHELAIEDSVVHLHRTGETGAEGVEAPVDDALARDQLHRVVVYPGECAEAADLAAIQVLSARILVVREAARWRS